MIVSNLEMAPGQRVVAHLGIAQGSTVRAKHAGRDFLSGLKNIVGGELKAYTELMTEAREEAVAVLGEILRYRGASFWTTRAFSVIVTDTEGQTVVSVTASASDQAPEGWTLTGDA